MSAFCLLNNYSNTPYELKGVNIDNISLMNLFSYLNIQHTIVFNGCKKDIVNIVNILSPSILWVCGHGRYSKRLKSNDFILRDYFNENNNKIVATLNNDFFLKTLLKVKSPLRFHLIIVDICQSETLINLKYFLENGIYVPNKSTIPLINDDDLIVAVSAAKNNQNSYETNSMGGELTHSLTKFFGHQTFFTLKDLELYFQKEKKTYNISVNKIIPLNYKLPLKQIINE